MTRPMTAAQAREYATQWGDGTFCPFYQDLERPDSAKAALERLDDCKAIAQAGQCCGTPGPCLEDLDALERLALYLRGVLGRAARKADLEAGQ